MSSLRGRDLISAADLSADEIGRLFALATELKAEYRAERCHANPPLERRTLAMLFQKPSLHNCLPANNPKRWKCRLFLQKH